MCARARAYMRHACVHVRELAIFLAIVYTENTEAATVPFSTMAMLLSTPARCRALSRPAPLPPPCNPPRTVVVCDALEEPRLRQHKHGRKLKLESTVGKKFRLTLFLDRRLFLPTSSSSLSTEQLFLLGS